jgi:hypothetical protein
MIKDDEPSRPMTLGSMRRHGVRGLQATCQHCGHERAVSMDDWPDDDTVPSFGPRMRCSRCGQLGATAVPNWIERADRLSGSGRAMMVARLTAERCPALQPLGQAAYSIIAARLSVAEDGPRWSFWEPDKYADADRGGLLPISWVYAPGRLNEPTEILGGPEHPIECEFDAP